MKPEVPQPSLFTIRFRFYFFHLFLFAAFGIGVVSEAFSTSVSTNLRIGACGVMVFAALVFLLAFVHTSFQPIKSATFYEKSFVLVNGNQSSEFTYDDLESISMERVAAIRVFPLLSLRDQIHLDFKKSYPPVTIVANPFNGILKRDLYSWLKSKAN